MEIFQTDFNGRPRTIYSIDSIYERKTPVKETKMRTTTSQDKEFISSVVSSTLLEEAIEWIQDNLYPETVFNENALREWAESNGYVEDMDDE